MSSRGFFPADARMHREEEWTLSRMSSNQAGEAKTDRSASDTGIAAHNSPENNVLQGEPTRLHRRFVFTDPIAFRSVSQSV